MVDSAASSAQYSVDIVLRVIDKASSQTNKILTDLEKTTKSLKLGKQINNINNAGLMTPEIMADARKEFSKFSVTTDKQIKQIVKGTEGMNFGFLSMIFAGMALQRTFGGFLTSLRTNYQQIIPENSKFNKQINNLSGSFAFLKFTIFDAFARNPLVESAMKFMIDTLVSLANFIDDHPSLGLTIVGITAFITALGTALFLAGQGITVAMGLKALAGEIGPLTTLLKGGALTTNLGVLIPQLKELSTIQIGALFVAGAATIFSGFEFYQALKEKDVIGAIGYGLATTFGLAAGAAFFAGAGTFILPLAIAAVVTIGITKFVQEQKGEKEQEFANLIVNTLQTDLQRELNSVELSTLQLEQQLRDRASNSAALASQFEDSFLFTNKDQAILANKFSDEVGKTLDSIRDRFEDTQGNLVDEEGYRRAILLEFNLRDSIVSTKEDIVTADANVITSSGNVITQLSAEQQEVIKTASEYRKLEKAKKDAANLKGQYGVSGSDVSYGVRYDSKGRTITQTFRNGRLVSESAPNTTVG
jgi:hypothetical protein